MQGGPRAPYGAFRGADSGSGSTTMGLAGPCVTGTPKIPPYRKLILPPFEEERWQRQRAR